MAYKELHDMAESPEEFSTPEMQNAFVCSVMNQLQACSRLTNNGGVTSHCPWYTLDLVKDHVPRNNYTKVVSLECKVCRGRQASANFSDKVI